MFIIGDFAGLGRVSVRMLRHYDAVGLLRPARVDASTGYRYYTADQLGRLRRIVALRELGFSLAQVGAFLDEYGDAAGLTGLLRLRQAELVERIAVDTERLRAVEARLRAIEREGTMPSEDVIVKSTQPIRIAERSGVATSYGPEDISPVIRPLYEELMAALDKANVAVTGPGVAHYESAGEEAVLVHAGVEVAVDAVDGAEVVDLPRLELAATIIHRGPMDDIMSTMERLGHWLEDNGYRSTGLAREIYLDYDPADPSNGVTEMQVPVEKVSDAGR